MTGDEWRVLERDQPWITNDVSHLKHYLLIFMNDSSQQPLDHSFTMSKIYLIYLQMSQVTQLKKYF